MLTVLLLGAVIIIGVLIYFVSRGGLGGRGASTSFGAGELSRSSWSDLFGGSGFGNFGRGRKKTNQGDDPSHPSGGSEC